LDSSSYASSGVLGCCVEARILCSDGGTYGMIWYLFWLVVADVKGLEWPIAPFVPEFSSLVSIPEFKSSSRNIQSP
jgi:hypothetical protein